MERLLALKAGAGSGKTFQLAIRYISLLLEGRDPNGILAITFTNKATKEMRERVFKFLQFSALPPDQQSRIAEELASGTGLPVEEVYRRLEGGELFRKVTQQPVRITTIDSFLHQILRKFGVYIGVDPHFESGERGVKELDLQFFSRLTSDQLRWYFELEERGDKLINRLEELYLNWFQLSPLFPREERLEQLEEEFIELTSQWKGIVRRWEELLRNSSARNSSLKTLYQKWQEGEEPLQKYLKRQKLPPESVELALQFWKVKRRAELLWNRLELGRLASLVELYRQERLQLQRERGVYTFSDVALLVYQLLRGEGRIEPEFLYFRLDSRITDILIDEFQDTSLLQWRILEPLVEEIGAGIGSRELERSFFYVGDPNQAIYQWRGGDARLFEGVCQQLQMEQRTLQYNYRSGWRIVEFVNRLFQLKQKPVPSTGEGYLEIESLPFSPKSPDYLQWVVDRVEQLLEAGIPPEEIGILSRDNDRLGQLELLLEERGIPVATSSSREGLLSEPEVRGIWSLLRYIEESRNRETPSSLYIAEFQAIAGRTPSNQWLEEVLYLDPPSRIVKRIIEEFNLYTPGSLKFWEFTTNYLTLSELLQRLEEGGIEGESGEGIGVNLLTIHKSKGLEFNYLFLLDFLQNSRPSQQFLIGYRQQECSCSSPEPCQLDPQLISIQIPKTQRVHNQKVDNYHPNFDREYQQLVEEVKERGEREKRNLVYVGMTRARKGLFLPLAEQRGEIKRLFSQLTPQRSGRLDPPTSAPRPAPPKLLRWEELPHWGPQQLPEEGEREETREPELALYGRALHYGLEIGDLTAPLNRYRLLLEGEWPRLEQDWRWATSELKRFLEGLGEEWYLYRELPFRGRGQEWQADLVIETQSRFIVIDYKSAFFRDHSRLEGYFAQVKNYLSLLGPVFRKPGEGWLLLIHQRRWVRVPFPEG